MTAKMIQDKYSIIPDRQTRYKVRNRDKGVCLVCGKPKDKVGVVYCLRCRETRKACCMRYRKKFKAWKAENPNWRELLAQ